MNYSDTARVKAVLKSCGFSYVEKIEDADIVIFDTCSVRQKSEDKITWKLKEISKFKKIWITGCMAQHNFKHSSITNKLHKKKTNTLMQKWNFQWTIKTKEPEIIWITNDEINNLNKTHKNIENKELLFVNNAFNPFFYNLQKTYSNLELVFRIDDLWFLPKILKKLWYSVQETINTNEYSEIIPDFISNNTCSLTAYIPISTWCNQFCSFCIVPYARWLEKHRPVIEIVSEAEKHIQNWAKEIYLLGQIVNKHPEFTTIIKEILKIKWLKRLRYTSPYPTYYTDELFQLHQNEKKLCPHIHIPLQSWSNSILKKMFRGYTSEQFKTFIDKIRNLKREISITTDIIVWFPDETEQNFTETIELVKYCNFSMIYIGIYSPRPWTYASRKMEDNIPYQTKHNRRTQLNSLLQKLSTEQNQKEIWKTKYILIQKKTKDWFEWYTNNQKTVIITKNTEIQTNSFQKVKIIDWKSLKLFWEIIKK